MLTCVHVYGCICHFHRLESPTRSLLINAGKDIFIKSGAGNIDASCLNDIQLRSTEGSVSTIISFTRSFPYPFPFLLFPPGPMLIK